MALSTAEKRKVKKHLNYLPSTEVLDSKFESIDDDADWLSDTQAQIVVCDTRRTSYDTAKAAVDNITSGFGATINEGQKTTALWEHYMESVTELSRIVEYPSQWPQSGGLKRTGYIGGL